VPGSFLRRRNLRLLDLLSLLLLPLVALRPAAFLLLWLRPGLWFVMDVMVGAFLLVVLTRPMLAFRLCGMVGTTGTLSQHNPKQ